MLANFPRHVQAFKNYHFRNQRLDIVTKMSWVTVSVLRILMCHAGGQHHLCDKWRNSGKTCRLLESEKCDSEQFSYNI